MSDKPDRPDWLDELYQDNNSDLPPKNLDASIRTAARHAHGRRAWYQRTGALASVATMALVLGIVTVWLDAPQDYATVAVEPASAPAHSSESQADLMEISNKPEALRSEAILVADEAPASPAAVSANREQVLQKSS
jgi:hypothetical protein